MSKFLQNLYTSFERVDEKARFIVGGVTLGTTSLWLGAFIISFAERDSWWEFPVFVTASVGVIVGFVITLYGAIEI